MNTFELTAVADADGVLRLNIPVEEAGEYEVTLTTKRKPRPDEVDERGWPIGYFEATCGVIDDDEFQARIDRIVPSLRGSNPNEVST